MQKKALKVLTGSILGMFVLSLAASGTNAGSFTISGNGANSNSAINLGSSCNSETYQFNKDRIDLDVNHKGDTGDNEAKNNTGGNVDLDSGDATSSTLITINGNINENDSEDCCCGENEEEVTAKIQDNGRNSRNRIRSRSRISKFEDQANERRISARIRHRNRTNNNTANGNTGGETDVTSGDSSSSTDILIRGNRNRR